MSGIKNLPSIIGDSGKGNGAKAWAPTVLSDIALKKLVSGAYSNAGMMFSPNGLTMLLVFASGNPNVVYQFSMTKPYDLASLTQVKTASLIGNGVVAATMSPDGRKLWYFMGGATDAFDCLELATPWDLTGATLRSGGVIAGPNISPLAMRFSKDGTLLVTLSGSSISRYPLTTPFDISTWQTPLANIVVTSWLASTPASGLLTYYTGFEFSPSGKDIFLIGYRNASSYRTAIIHLKIDSINNLPPMTSYVGLRLGDGNTYTTTDYGSTSLPEHGCITPDGKQLWWTNSAGGTTSPNAYVYKWQLTE